MSILKIKDICLVTGLSNDNGECRAAYDWMKEKNLDFQHLSYYDPVQHDELFANYNTWVSDMNLNRFPFVHYTEIDDNYNSRPVFLNGYNEIVGGNLEELSKL